MFSYRELAAFLTLARDTVAVMRFCDGMAGAPGLLLRHDVDLCVEAAWRLSRLELEVGVRSTYFLLTSAETYNCNSRRNAHRIRSMVEDGFEIGLHFDPARYHDVPEDRLIDMVRREGAILSDLAASEVRSVSLHNPSIRDRYPLFEGYRNAYDPSIFNEEVYLSDSRMIFRRHPGDILDVAKRKTAQLLLHPMHYSENGDGYPAPHIAYLRSMIGQVDDEFRCNSSYAQRVSGTLAGALRASLPEEGGR